MLEIQGHRVTFRCASTQHSSFNTGVDDKPKSSENSQAMYDGGDRQI
jgi:hypothetical protein